MSHAHARLRPRKHFKRFHQSRQGGRIPTRSFQQALSFSVRRSAYSHIVRELPGLWHGQLGIEPTAHGFGDRVATLVHLPVYVSPGSHRWKVRGVLSCGTASAWYASLRGSLRSASYLPPVYPAVARSAPLPSRAGSRAGREEVGPCPRHPRLSPQEASNQVLITLQSCEYRTPLHIDARSCTREPRSTLSQNTLHPP